MAKFCPYCGNPVKETDKFCIICGKPMLTDIPKAEKKLDRKEPMKKEEEMRVEEKVDEREEILEIEDRSKKKI